MASIAGHEQGQQGRGQMKRKQVTAIITAAILAVSACMPVSSVSAMAAEAAGGEVETAAEDEVAEAKAEGYEAKAAVDEVEAAEETTTAIESEEPDEAEAAEASSNEAATEETSNAAATEASTEEVTTESSAEDAAEEAATEANPEDTAEEATAEEATSEVAEAEETAEEVVAEEAAAEGEEENQLEDFSIALNATEIELHVGETFQLELTVNDGQNDGTEGSGRNYEVGWRYDDTYLLDAYDGLVVAKHAGTEVVTAVVTVYEGWEKYIYRASCTRYRGCNCRSYRV